MPLEYTEYYMRDVKSPSDYACKPSDRRGADKLPFTYDRWNEKWYSNVCRPWYQRAEDNSSIRGKEHCAK